MSISTGFVAAGFEPVREAFERNFEDGLELGAGFAALLGDELVVDLHGGFADRKGEMPWDERTLCPVYSTTKPVAALVVAMLVDQGCSTTTRRSPATGRNSPPREKARHGRRGAVASGRRAGFPEPIDPDLWLDPPALAAASPNWRRCGRRARAPAITADLGLYRRRAGAPRRWPHAGNDPARRICAPLGIDFCIGTPESEHARCAWMLRPKAPTQFGPRNDALTAAFLTPWAAPQRGGAAWRTAEMPSANGHGTAQAVARLFAPTPERPHRRDAAHLAGDMGPTHPRARLGRGRILPGRVSLAAGVMRNRADLGPNPETLWHSGWGGSGGFGDPDAGLSGAYVMNRQGTHLLEDARRSRIWVPLVAASR